MQKKLERFARYADKRFPAGHKRIIAMRLFARACYTKATEDAERNFWRKRIHECEELEEKYARQEQQRREAQDR